MLSEREREIWDDIVRDHSAGFREPLPAAVVGGVHLRWMACASTPDRFRLLKSTLSPAAARSRAQGPGGGRSDADAVHGGLLVRGGNVAVAGARASPGARKGGAADSGLPGIV